MAFLIIRPPVQELGVLSSHSVLLQHHFEMSNRAAPGLPGSSCSQCVPPCAVVQVTLLPRMGGPLGRPAWTTSKLREGQLATCLVYPEPVPAAAPSLLQGLVTFVT